ncbi:MAG: YbaN family protein [Myxococcales bacterium]
MPDARHSRWRLPLLALGLACTALGFVGLVVPGLPTTPFLLVALWAFSRSSERLHAWLHEHPRFGPGLRAWEAHGVIPLRVKLTALLGMAGSLAVMIFVVDVAPLVLALTVVVMLAGAAFILSRPGAPR